MTKKFKLLLSHLISGIWLVLISTILVCMTISLPISAAAYSGESFQKFIVNGTVTSVDEGIPLPGVNILVKGTMNGIITNLQGEYYIEINSPDAILMFSFIGYIAQEIPVNGQKVINVQMVMETLNLDEIVVIGYGTQKKINLSGAVDVVTSQQLENRPVTNVSQALQGLSPNLNITVSGDGGEMGAKMIMNIRGIGSISGGAPYVLIDGIEQDIYNLNPNDIESISVLKDAAASAIYGARAAFGVILITTKKGRNDGLSVNYSNNLSFSAPTIVPHSINSLDFAKYFNVASANDGNPPIFQDIIINNMNRYQAGEIDYWTIPYPTPQYWLGYSGAWANTDWYKVNYKDWVPNSTHNLSVSGGDKRTQFYISASTFNQSGLLNFGDDSHTRNTINSQVNTKVNNWVKFNFSSKLTRSNITRPSYDRNLFYNELSRQWPTNAPYFPDGNLNFGSVQFLLEKSGKYNENQNEFTLLPGIEIEPVKGWVIYANYRWKMNTSGITNHEAKMIGILADGSQSYVRPNNSFASYEYEKYYNSPNIYSTYNKKIGVHDFTILAGFEQELIQYTSTYAKRYDLVSDKVPSLTTATGRSEASGSLGHASTRSFFGRFNYNLNEKYLLEFSMRHDGSSKFPKNYRWGTFPSASAAYVVSKETFWSSIEKYVNMFKIRASYGSLGNQDVENYLYVERLPFSTNLPYIMGNELPNYAGMAGLISPGLTWEKVKTSNVGVDMGFINNRLNMSFDYFIRNTFDMLGPAESLPIVLGTDVPRSNNATLKTKGFELVLGWKDNINDFSYNARFVLSDAKSTITRYYNPQKLLTGVFYEGAELGEIWGYTTDGLFKSDAEAQNPDHDQTYLSRQIWRAGDVNYKDMNTDNKIDIGRNTVGDPGDLSVIGNSSPRFAYSFILGSSWKGFDFNMLWQGIAKRDIALNGPLFWGAAGFPDGQWFSIGLKEHMDYWTEDNTDAYWPRPYLDKGVKNHQVQTRYLQNGAYLRLKSLQIGYTLPGSLTKKARMQKLRIYVSGENLLTFTKLITMFDPEVTGGNSGSGTMYPLQKVVSAGLNVSF